MPGGSFGTEPADDGSLEPQRKNTLPLFFVDTLPATGAFIGALYFQKTVSAGWYWWNGATFINVGAGGGGGGDMTKATYDTDNDGIVDKAEQLEGPGAGANITTAATLATALTALATHLADLANPHSTTAAQVGSPPNARSIATTAPLSGGGDLSADRTLSILTAGITNALLADMVAHTMKVRAAGTDGVPSDLAIAGNAFPGRVGTAAISSIAVAAQRVVGRVTGGSLGALTPPNLLSILNAAIVGAAFPGAPADGDPFFHTGAEVPFHYSDTAGAWLADHIYGLPFGIDADTAATAYLKMGDQLLSTTFTDTIGWLIGSQVAVVGLSLNMASSGTATIQVFDDGGAVTNGSLALSSQQSKADDAMGSNAIAASSILGVKVTSGTVKGPARGMIWLRRVAP